MIDRLAVIYGLRKEKPFDPKYKPEDAVVVKRLLNPRGKRLTVIFPGWHTHHQPIDFLARRLARHGWAVLLYDFHDDILAPDDELVVESFKYIKKSVSRDIDELIDKHKYDEVSLLGISIGTVPLALVADTYARFTSATIVLGGDDLAVDMWHGMRTQHIRHAFEKMHIGIRKLDKEWYGIAPVDHLRHFKGKRVKMVMSLTDKFILTKYQKKLLRRLRENGAHLKVRRRFTGHAMTIILFCLFGKP